MKVFWANYIRDGLRSVELELVWVNNCRDRTDRVATLYQISQMPWRQRQHLHFIRDFDDREIAYTDADGITQHRVIPGKGVGYVYWCNTDSLGIFYELVYVTDSREDFDAIRSSYCVQNKP